MSRAAGLASSSRAGAPAWSPRGRSIAYVAAGVAGASDVFVADADGSNRRPLTRTLEAESHPAWTPDGRRIAFARDDAGPGGSIVVVDSDGGNERVAVRSERYLPVEPAWRPRVPMPRAGRGTCS